jgi:hypothetical protein
MIRLTAPLSILALLTACFEEEAGFPVRATLADGQVLVGQVETDVLLLDGGLGRLAIPLDDVGEVVPVEGGDLAASGGNVGVWLRDGTELRGRWAEPELRMGIEVGGHTVGVDLPVETLGRFQFEGGTEWPTGTVYRVRTTWGDDFRVDPERTRLVIDSNLGTFEPFLSECVSANPLGDPTGDWRVELSTGTVLVGPLADAEITFALPLGPEEITVPLGDFVSLDRQVWGPPVAYEQDLLSPASPRPAEGWFDNGSLRQQRDYQYAH